MIYELVLLYYGASQPDHSRDSRDPTHSQRSQPSLRVTQEATTGGGSGRGTAVVGARDCLGQGAVRETRRSFAGEAFAFTAGGVGGGSGGGGAVSHGDELRKAPAVVAGQEQLRRQPAGPPRRGRRGEEEHRAHAAHSLGGGAGQGGPVGAQRPVREGLLGARRGRVRGQQALRGAAAGADRRDRGHGGAALGERDVRPALRVAVPAGVQHGAAPGRVRRRPVRRVRLSRVVHRCGAGPRRGAAGGDAERAACGGAPEGVEGEAEADPGVDQFHHLPPRPRGRGGAAGDGREAGAAGLLRREPPRGRHQLFRAGELGPARVGVVQVVPPEGQVQGDGGDAPRAGHGPVGPFRRHGHRERQPRPSVAGGVLRHGVAAGHASRGAAGGGVGHRQEGEQRRLPRAGRGQGASDSGAGGDGTGVSPP